MTLAVDDGELGAARAAQADASLRAAGFRVASTVTVPAPPAPLPDLAPIAGQLATGAPAVVLLLTSPARHLGSRAAAGCDRLHRHRRRRRGRCTSRRRPQSPAASPSSCRTRRSSRRPRRTAASPPTSRRSRRARSSRPASPPGTGRPTCSCRCWRRPASASRASGSSRWRSASGTRCRRTIGASTLARRARAGCAVRRAGAERRFAVRRGRALRVRQADRGQDAEAVDDHDDDGRDRDDALTSRERFSRRRRGGSRPSSSPGTTRCRPRSSRRGCR